MSGFALQCKRFTALLLFVCVVLLASMPMMAGAQDAMDEGSVFVSIRRYDGIDPKDMAEIRRHSYEGFLPIISASDGFIGYYWWPQDDVLVAMNLFTTPEEASASNEAARDYVAEHVAPLLPNPPQILEGFVDIGFVEMLDGMDGGDVSSLYASLRVYDGFSPDSLSEFVALVEGGFLPIMRETPGFFGYYLLHDGEGRLGAVSIFDSEASALASNDKARDFVAENLAAFLPNDPQITGGQLGIAVLAALEDGANLIDEDIFVSIRVYDGIDPADQGEIIRLASEGFLPIMRESGGFVGYYLLPAGDMLAAISMFDSAEQASASNEAARDFVAENLAPLLPNSPQIIEGGLDVVYVVDDEMMDESLSSLFAALRIYDNYDLTNREEAVALVEANFLPILQGADGLFSYFTMDDGVDRVVALSVYETEENALAANKLAADFVAEYMTAWIREEPTRVNGRLGVVALADVHMGANLIGERESDG